MKRETVCSQALHCLSCPLSPLRTGKDCRELTAQELAEIRKEQEHDHERRAERDDPEI